MKNFNLDLKSLMPKKNGLKMRIKQLEDLAQLRGLTEEELKELQGLEDILDKRKNRMFGVLSDGKILVVTGTVLAALITAAAKVYAIDKITAFEAAGEIITSAAFKEV